MDRNQAVVDRLAALPGTAGTRTVRENLSEALHALAGLREDKLPLELSLLADPDLVRVRRRAAAASTHEPDSPLTHLAAYLRAEQQAGRVRADLDVARTAVILLATLFGVALLADGDDQVQAGFVDGAVDLLLQGLEPR